MHSSIKVTARVTYQVCDIVFVDDELYFTYVNEGKGWQAWPYDQPFHLVLNLAIGGAWGRAGGGIDDGQFPQRMLIDYVRVYQTRD